MKMIKKLFFSIIVNNMTIIMNIYSALSYGIFTTKITSFVQKARPTLCVVETIVKFIFIVAAILFFQLKTAGCFLL